MAASRILHVVNSLEMGGTECALASLIERTRDRAEHSVLCIETGGPIAEHLQTHDVPVFILHKPPGSDPRVPLRIARLCRTIRSTIVHTRSWSGVNGIIGAVLARTPIVIHSEHGFAAGNKRRRRVRRLVAPFVDQMITVSAHLRRLLLEESGVRADKVTVIQNGVDVSRFRTLDCREPVRRALGYGPEDFVVGTVGRLQAEKNHRILVDAIATVSVRHSRVQLLLIGDGKERGILQQRIADIGLGSKVKLLGFRDDIPALLNALDVFVLPSRREGMSNALLEAMAVGLPVVAIRMGGNPGVVVDAVTGLLVPPGDVRALAEAVAFYTTNASARLEHGRAGHGRVQRNFTLEQMVTGYLSVYESGLARRGGWRHTHRRGETI